MRTEQLHSAWQKTSDCYFSRLKTGQELYEIGLSGVISVLIEQLWGYGLSFAGDRDSKEIIQIVGEDEMAKLSIYLNRGLPKGTRPKDLRLRTQFDTYEFNLSQEDTSVVEIKEIRDRSRIDISDYWKEEAKEELVDLLQSPLRLQRIVCQEGIFGEEWEVESDETHELSVIEWLCGRKSLKPKLYEEALSATVGQEVLVEETEDGKGWLISQEDKRHWLSETRRRLTFAPAIPLPDDPEVSELALGVQGDRKSLFFRRRNEYLVELESLRWEQDGIISAKLQIIDKDRNAHLDVEYGKPPFSLISIEQLDKDQYRINFPFGKGDNNLWMLKYTSFRNPELFNIAYGMNIWREGKLDYSTQLILPGQEIANVRFYAVADYHPLYIIITSPILFKRPIKLVMPNQGEHLAGKFVTDALFNKGGFWTS